MRSKPNINEFIHGGAADKIARGEKPGEEIKNQQIFRLPVSIIEAIKSESYARSVTEQRRVSAADVVEDAIRRMLGV